MKMKSYEKEGNTSGSIGAIITLVTGVGVAVLILIFIGALAGQTYTIVEPDLTALEDVATVTGDNITVFNHTTAQLANDWITPDSIVVSNNTGTEVGIGNFTITEETGLVQLSARGEWNNTRFLFNYTHGDTRVGHSVLNGVVSGFQGFETTGDYLPIIVIALVISIIMVLLLGFFTMGGKGGTSRNIAL